MLCLPWIGILGILDLIILVGVIGFFISVAYKKHLKKKE